MTPNLGFDSIKEDIHGQLMFDKGTKVIQGELQSFQQMALEKLYKHMAGGERTSTYNLLLYKKMNTDHITKIKAEII